MYEYLLTAFKLIIGLITAERLIYASLIALAFYVVWICFSLTFSFQHKFNRNCVKLYNFVKKNGLNANDAKSVDLKASKISSGFSHGWKKFKQSNYGKPSDFISRRDALDVEVNGGVLNQGKTLMRTFVNTVTFVLFVANFAYLGNNNTVTFYLLAESMVLPLILFLVLKAFYFVYTSVKQQLYKADIECLYELLDLLDKVFAKADGVNVMASQSEFVQGEDIITTGDSGEMMEHKIQEPEQAQEEAGEAETSEPETETEETQEEVEEESIASKYDFFKKKNIDVDKILNDGTKMSSSSSLPYINVDSDYVVKDDQPAVSKTITNLENGSELLGSMMQDKNSIKKLKKEEEEKAEAEKLEAQKAEEEKKNAESNAVQEESDDPFDKLGKFEIAENATPEINVEPKSSEESDASKSEETEQQKTETQEDVEENKLEIPDVEPIEIQKPEPEIDEPETKESTDVSEELKENIASVVGGFKAKSKLASGGVIIERNQPIARREKTHNYESAYSEATENEDFSDGFNSNGITHLSAENDADNILNSFRNSAGGYDDFQNYNAGMPNQMYGAGYNVPQYNQPYQYGQPNMGQPQQMGGYGVPNMPSYPNMQQNIQPQGFGGYQAPKYVEEDYDDEDYEEDFEEEDEAPKVAKPKKPAVKRTKENEPRPRNLKKKESKPVMEEQKTTKRGRPKKQVFDETVSIKNDKEFDEVLSRAEKLMKKSESGLSASQSKRIEKELKMLMDAMNKYKEGV